VPNYDCWLSGQVVWSGIIFAFRKPVAGRVTLAAESGGMEQSGEMRNASLSIAAGRVAHQLGLVCAALATQPAPPHNPQRWYPGYLLVANSMLDMRL